MAGPLLTVDTSGNPRVEVFADPDDLHPDTARVRMLRYSENRTWLVRGGVDVAPGVAALDWEVPFQVPATYRLEMTAADGVSLGFTDPSTVTVNYTGTVVHQPLSPDLWAPVRILKSSASSLGRPFDGEFVETEGGVVGHWVGSNRRGLRDVPVSLLAETLGAADMIQAILGTYETQQVGVICIRTSDRIRWPRTFFAHGDLEEIERNLKFRGQLIQFDAAMSEAEPPYPGLVVPLLTYDDLDVAYATYDLRDAAYSTYTDQDRDYSLAGLAG